MTEEFRHITNELLLNRKKMLKTLKNSSPSSPKTALILKRTKTQMYNSTTLPPSSPVSIHLVWFMVRKSCCVSNVCILSNKIEPSKTFMSGGQNTLQACTFHIWCVQKLIWVPQNIDYLKILKTTATQHTKMPVTNSTNSKAIWIWRLHLEVCSFSIV